MSLETQRAAITDYFKANWLETTVTVAYPNHPFVTPVGQPFLVLNLTNFDRSRGSIGMDQWLTRRVGAVQVDIYVLENTGYKTAAQMADTIEAMFESIEIVTSDSQTIKFRTPRTTNLSLNEERASNMEDSYFRLMTYCEYYVDEIKTS
jgi:hypothetical protein